MKVNVSSLIPSTLRRLFWRIFVSFWLASLTIMFATTYVIVNKFESSQYIQRHKQNIERVAHEIIRLHESGSPIPHRFPLMSPPPPDGPPPAGKPPRDRHGKMRGMKIISDNNEVIFESRFRKRETERVEFKLSGNSGREYAVLAATPPIPRFFEEVLQRFYSLQFFLILIASTLVSAFLSWNISKPLSQLGQFSRKYTAGSKSSVIPAHIFDRGDELSDLANDMAFMIEKVEHTLSAQQQLLHDVSHELRAPLARLQATIGLVEQQGSEKHTQRLHQECKRIDTLIQEILNYSRLNRDSGTRQKTELAPLLQSLIDDLVIEYPEHPINFCIKAENLEAAIYPNALSRALENILRNACKYSPVNTPVDLILENKEREVIITIRDRGTGVSEQELDLILKPFYRAGNQMHTQGFGLGLSIAQKAMEKHHGRLEIKNHPEGGLLVSCFLPKV